MGKKKIEKTVKELNRLTGLNFQLDLSEIDDTDEAVIRLEQIVDSWKEKNSKNAYWKRFLTGELEEDDMMSGSARFHVKIDERRALYIVETPRKDNEVAVDILRQLFVVRTNDQVIGVDGRRIALVRTLKDKEFTFKLTADGNAPMPASDTAYNNTGGEVKPRYIARHIEYKSGHTVGRKTCDVTENKVIYNRCKKRLNYKPKRTQNGLLIFCFEISYHK